MKDSVHMCICFFWRQGEKHLISLLRSQKQFTKPTSPDGEIRRHLRKLDKFSIPQVPCSPSRAEIGGGHLWEADQARLCQGPGRGASAREGRSGRKRGVRCKRWQCIPQNMTDSVYCFVHQEIIALRACLPCATWVLIWQRDKMAWLARHILLVLQPDVKENCFQRAVVFIWDFIYFCWESQKEESMMASTRGQLINI